MRVLLFGVALLTIGCGSSSPTAPTPPVTPPVVVVPPVVPVLAIQVSPCPTVTAGVDLGFYQEIGCNSFDQPMQPVRRWMVAPKLYLKTVDEGGAPIDAVTLDTVQNAMVSAAPSLTAGRLTLSVERGSASREGQSGWITVKWPAASSAVCGRSEVAVDGGWIELNYKVAFCACGGSQMRSRTAKHELGHALGYWHTDSGADLMSGLAQPTGCDAEPSARELQAIGYHYR